jgi:hypothetical protein
MGRENRIGRWQRVGICSLLCLCMQGFAIANNDASTNDASTTATPKKPAHSSSHTSKTSATKTKPPTSAHATTKHAPAGTSAHLSSPTGKSRGKKGSKTSKTAQKRGQQGIDGDRARAIQEALIREHYMQGVPSGTWDSATQTAMQRYQADQGWQAKTTPDSRALIKLGLGPSHDHLLNPESAMTSSPKAGDPKAATKPDPAQNNLPQ